MRYADKKPFAHLYKSARWQLMRETHLTGQPFCVFCATEGKSIPGFAVDHIKEHKGDVDLFHDMDNLQTLCEHCHNSRKQRMERGGVVIQYGPDGFPLKPRRQT